MRLDKKDYYLAVAKAVSLRLTCLRRQYGAVIVKNDEIIATGYNGSPRSDVNCCDVGMCQKNMKNLPHGSCYAECKAVHAEMNAIISASRQDMIDADLYIYGSENGKTITAKPCVICEKLIRNAGITHIVSSGAD